MSDEKERTCKTCDTNKPLSAFEKGRRECKACRNEKRVARRKKLSERRTEAKGKSGEVVSFSPPKTSTRPSLQDYDPIQTEDLPESMPSDPEDDIYEVLKADFRKFLYVIWKHLGLPTPTPLQYDIAYNLQHGDNRLVIQAFRGVGKSFITAAYVLWRLLIDPQLKVLVVSASKLRSDNFTIFVKNLIETVPVLEHLKPRESQRNSNVSFDVGPAMTDQSPSVLSLGITGQLTGTRAGLIVADDVEVPNNSATADMREKLLEKTREFTALRKPKQENPKTVYLGTPQTEDSIYVKLPEGYQVLIWPAQVPTDEQAEQYGNDLAPYVRRMLTTKKAGAATDPDRFGMDDLIERMADYGKAGYALQFMLNTQLSDLERFPLKVRDLIVTSIDKSKAPLNINWMPDPERVLGDIPNLAMAGDKFHYPRSVSDEFSEFTGSVLSIDPSGRGKDETGYAVVKMLNGFLYVTRCGGLRGGYDDATLDKLADIAKEEKVNVVMVEDNFGDGMWTKLFQPVLFKKHECKIEEEKHHVRKEERIIDTLEPVLARHKLVMDEKVLMDDFHSAQAYDAEDKFTKTLVHQMTRISYEKGALKHDDRLDALALGVAYWVEQMAQDEQKGVDDHKQELLDKELERFMNHALPIGRQGRAVPRKKFTSVR